MNPYNSLTDPHLSGYFSHDQRKREIIKAGLINREGELIAESTYKLNNIIAEKKYKIDEKNRCYKILPRVNMPSEDFCKTQPLKFMSAGGNNHRQATHTRSSLERVKSAPDYFKLKAYNTPFLPPNIFSNNLPHSSSLKSKPHPSFSWKTNSSNEVIKLKVSANKHKYSGFVTCKSLPLIKAGTDVGRELKLSGTLQLISSNHSPSNDNLSRPCLVTMRYHGDSLKLLDRWCVRRDEVAVEQQLNGGGGLIIFREMLSHGSNFTIESRRQSGQAFSLTLYVNRTQNTRISVCCETKHKRGYKLGGSGGQFSLLQVKNPAYCQSCSEKKNLKTKNKKKNKKNCENLKTRNKKTKEITTDDDSNDDAGDDEVDDDNEINNTKTKNKNENIATAVCDENHDDDHRMKKNKKRDDSGDAADTNTRVAREKTKNKKMKETKNKKQKKGKKRINSFGNKNVSENTGVLNEREEDAKGRTNTNTHSSFDDANETAGKINGIIKNAAGGDDGEGSKSSGDDGVDGRYSSDDDGVNIRNGHDDDNNDKDENDEKKENENDEKIYEKSEDGNYKGNNDKDSDSKHGDVKKNAIDDYDRNIEDVTETLVGSVYRRIEDEVMETGSDDSLMYSDTDDDE